MAEAKIGRPITEFELASHLMYPKVFAEYAADRATFGDVSTLPTSVFFYGMQSGQEINIDLERGKTLIVKYVTTVIQHPVNQGGLGLGGIGPVAEGFIGLLFGVGGIMLVAFWLGDRK